MAILSLCSYEDSNETDCSLTNPVDTTALNSRNVQITIKAGTDCNDSFKTEGGIDECKFVQEFRYCANIGADTENGDCIIPRYTEDGNGEGLTCQDSFGVNECGDPTSSHLHLEMFIARGIYSGDNKIRFNPLLMFTRPLVDEFTFTSSYTSPDRPDIIYETYYPIEYLYKFVDGRTYSDSNTLGLVPGNLNSFTPLGNLPDTYSPILNGFFQIQTPTPPEIPEWWLDGLGPLAYPDVPRMIIELVPFLQSYGYPASYQYIGPNCVGLPYDLDITEASPGLTCIFDERNDAGNGGTLVNDPNQIDIWEPLRPDVWPTQIP